MLKLDQLCVSSRISDGSEERCLILRQERKEREIGWPDGAQPHASLSHDLLLLRSQGVAAWSCRVLNVERKIVADIVLPDALNPRASLHAGHLLAWDRHGRVVDVDIETGEVRTLTFG